MLMCVCIRPFLSECNVSQIDSQLFVAVLVCLLGNSSIRASLV